MSTAPHCDSVPFPPANVVGCDTFQEKAAALTLLLKTSVGQHRLLSPCWSLSLQGPECPPSPTGVKCSTEEGGGPEDTVAFATLPSHIASAPSPPPPPPPCAGCNEECTWLLSLEWEVKAKNTTSAPQRVGRGWWQSSTLDSSLRVRCKPHSQTTAKPHSQTPQPKPRQLWMLWAEHHCPLCTGRKIRRL